MPGTITGAGAFHISMCASRELLSAAALKPRNWSDGGWGVATCRQGSRQTAAVPLQRNSGHPPGSRTAFLPVPAPSL